MNNVYEDHYGVSFNGHHSFGYYHLLPTSAPVIAPPVVKTFYIDVPGADGSLDLTEVLTGFPTYGDRNGEFNFMIYAPRNEWYNIYNQIVQDLNGKRVEVVLDEDREYFYNGRLTVAAPAFAKTKGTIKITGTFESERYVNDEYSGNDWLWDPFDFETGIAREYYQIKVRNKKTVMLIGSSLVVCPKFKLESGNLSVVVNGRSYQLRTGNNIFIEVLIGQNENKEVQFVGNGVVTVTYRIGGAY